MTVAGKLVVENFFNKQWIGGSLSLSYFLIKAMQEGVKMGHMGEGTQ